MGRRKKGTMGFFNWKNQKIDVKAQQEQELAAAKVRRFLQPLRSELPEFNSALKTRVLARMRETQTAQSYFLRFGRLAWGATLSLVLVVSIGLYLGNGLGTPNYV